MALETNKRIVVLVGGVGGAKLALGLQALVPPENLTIIVNTGDDFWHYGLRICPDIDTVLYTLSGRVNTAFGWGVAGDTTTALDALRDLGEETWFRLGDKDIATHLLRTHWLRHGQPLTQIVRSLAERMGIQAAVLPMTDDDVATKVMTVEHGELDFQEYFVRHRWQPVVRSLRYAGAEAARISDAVRVAIEQADAILFGPSNPWLSIAPILALPSMHDLLTAQAVPRVAITPIVGGKALKGPAAKLMAELGYEVSAAQVAAYYGDVITGFISDVRDAAILSHGLDTVRFDTIMKTDDDKINLSRQILNWLEREEVV